MTTTYPAKTKCRAQDPNTCPYHGALNRAERAFKAGDVSGYMQARGEAMVAGTHTGEIIDFLEGPNYNDPAVMRASIRNIEAIVDRELAEVAATEPLRVPSAGSPYQAINYLPAGTFLQNKVVTTQAQLRAAVNDSSGPRGKQHVRQVIAEMGPKQRFRKSDAPETVINGPSDGRPIVVDLGNAYNDATVASGIALVQARSTHGGSVRVTGSAAATIITPPGKLQIRASGDSRVTVVPSPGARGLITVGRDAEVNIVAIPGVEHSLDIHRLDRREV